MSETRSPGPRELTRSYAMMCPKCKGAALLCTAASPIEMTADSEPYEAGREEPTRSGGTTFWVDAELSGHYCEGCGEWVSLEFSPASPDTVTG